MNRGFLQRRKATKDRYFFSLFFFLSHSCKKKATCSLCLSPFFHHLYYYCIFFTLSLSLSFIVDYVLFVPWFLILSFSIFKAKRRRKKRADCTCHPQTLNVIKVICCWECATIHNFFHTIVFINLNIITINIQKIEALI